MALVALVSYLVFSFVLIPLKIRGKSMEPTYHDGSFAFCWRGKYIFSKPQRFDVVAVRLAGNHVMLLKRIVAFAGETVEFRGGQLFVNDSRLDEPYVRLNARWNLPPRKIATGKVYVVGDNRGGAMERHRFGQVSSLRIVGGVVP
jgi:signal peptidase I